MKKQKILLVDDHCIVREGFARLLVEEAQNREVLQAENGRAALGHARRHDLDVAVVDINMEDMDGLALTTRLKAMRPDIRVVILSVHEEEPFISRSLAAGADGFLSKRCAPAELGGAIKAVCRGETPYLGADVSRRLALAGLNQGQSPLERLSKREFEVCRGLARGDSMRAIAARLHISPKTGYVYRGNIFRKLEVSSLAALIQLARRYGIV